MNDVRRPARPPPEGRSRNPGSDALHESRPTHRRVPDPRDGASSIDASGEAAGLSERFTTEELKRYARHFVLPGVGVEGQAALREARVLCVGAGGLGSPLAMYLAAAGVGTLGLVDFDAVDASNLQRQILHGTGDVGRDKLDSAVERLNELNPNVRLVRHDDRLASENALDILEPYDVVVDGTDNFPTRYLVNDACVLLGKPNVYGSVFRWEGQLSVFAAPEGWREGRERGPCYRCLFRTPPPPELVQNCAEGGVMGVLPGIIGSLQAMETVKWILGAGEPMVGRLQIFDALETEWREVSVRRNPECPVCGDAPSQTDLIDYEVFCGVASPARPASDADGVPTLTVHDARERLSGSPRPLLLDVREPWEWTVSNLAPLGAVHVPLGELLERLDEIPRGGEIVVYCRSGARSADATRALLREGYPSVFNLAGGLKAWAAEIDEGMEVA